EVKVVVVLVAESRLVGAAAADMSAVVAWWRRDVDVDGGVVLKMVRVARRGGDDGSCGGCDEVTERRLVAGKWPEEGGRKWSERRRSLAEKREENEWGLGDGGGFVIECGMGWRGGGGEAAGGRKMAESMWPENS
nr:hypothetical protein [Tanacetum cinerariifolium]